MLLEALDRFQSSCLRDMGTSWQTGIRQFLWVGEDTRNAGGLLSPRPLRPTTRRPCVRRQAGLAAGEVPQH